jgi:hypothetical protein
MVPGMHTVYLNHFSHQTDERQTIRKPMQYTFTRSQIDADEEAQYEDYQQLDGYDDDDDQRLDEGDEYMCNDENDDGYAQANSSVGSSSSKSCAKQPSKALRESMAKEASHAPKRTPIKSANKENLRTSNGSGTSTSRLAFGELDQTAPRNASPNKPKRVQQQQQKQQQLRGASVIKSNSGSKARHEPSQVNRSIRPVATTKPSSSLGRSMHSFSSNAGSTNTTPTRDSPDGVSLCAPLASDSTCGDEATNLPAPQVDDVSPCAPLASGSKSRDEATTLSTQVDDAAAQEEQKLQDDTNAHNAHLECLPMASSSEFMLPHRVVNADDTSAGTHPCLFFIGGFPCGLDSWDAITDDIPTHIKCVIACAPGLDSSCHAQPAASDGGVSHERMSAMLLHTIKMLSPQQPVLLVVQGSATQWAMGAVAASATGGLEGDSKVISKIVVVQLDKLDKADEVALQCASVAQFGR